MKKILFIDSDKELQVKVQSYFPMDKFRVVCGNDAVEGLHKCKNEDFDFIIADSKMAKLDVAKFYKQVRDIQASRRAEMSPIIFLSEMPDEVRSQNPKFEKTEYLQEPFDKESLYECMGLFQKNKNKAQIKTDSKIIINPGEVLFHQGDDADCVYFVMSGLLKGTRQVDSKHLTIGQIGPGEIVGEMAILNQEKRLLTITAVERTEVMMISADKMLSMVNGQPKWIKLMIETFSKRLGSTIKQFAQ